MVRDVLTRNLRSKYSRYPRIQIMRMMYMFGTYWSVVLYVRKNPEEAKCGVQL